MTSPLPASWLAAESPAHAWSLRPWTRFPEVTRQPRALAILPLFSFSSHGAGLPLDAEEVLGSTLLRRACEATGERLPSLLLPPLRFGVSPYPHTFFGLTPPDASRQIHEIAAAVRAAGFSRLVFFSTSPWHEEWIDATSRDVRQELGIQTFVITLSGLGLDVHPTSPQRATAAAWVAHLLGTQLLPDAERPAAPDSAFRPGNFRTLPALSGPFPAVGPGLPDAEALHLAHLLAECHARKGLDGSPQAKPLPLVPLAPSAPTLEPFPAGYRTRYLASVAPEQLPPPEKRAQAWVLVPTGAIEQHGPHLPVGVDAILGQGYLAAALPSLAAGEEVWVAPPITFGKSNEHTGFPGTISVSATTHRALLRSLVHDLRRLGFQRIAILNTHGGNSAVLVTTVRELQGELSPHFRLGLLSGLFKPELSAQEATYGFHAGEWETSLLLALAPQAVDLSRAVCEYPARMDDPGELRPENAPAIFSWITRDVSSSGVMGDAPAASPEKGQHWLSLFGLSIVTRLRELGL